MDFSKYNEIISSCLKEKFICLNGRASREEFFVFFSFCLTINIVVILLIALVRPTHSFIELVLTIIDLFLFFPFLSVNVRRLHDIEKDGKLILIPIISLALSSASLILSYFLDNILVIVAIALLLLFMFSYSIILLQFTKKGLDIPNKYGESPYNDNN